MTGSLGVLVDMGVVSVNTQLLDVWPELDVSIHTDLRDITLRQLLSHTAGVERVNAAPFRFGNEAAGSVVEKRRAFATGPWQR